MGQLPNFSDLLAIVSPFGLQFYILYRGRFFIRILYLCGWFSLVPRNPWSILTVAVEPGDCLLVCHQSHAHWLHSQSLSYYVCMCHIVAYRLMTYVTSVQWTSNKDTLRDTKNGNVEKPLNCSSSLSIVGSLEFSVAILGHLWFPYK